MNEVESRVRAQMKNKRGTDTFVASARIASFNRLFGLSVAAAYRQPDLPNQKPKDEAAQKLPTIQDLSGFSA